MAWNNAFAICTACGDSGEPVCASGPSCMPSHDPLGLCVPCGTEGEIACQILDDACEEDTVAIGPSPGICTACGSPNSFACLDDSQPCDAPNPFDAILEVCAPCGGHGQVTCEYPDVPRCDAGLARIDLDPIRSLIEDLVLTQVTVPQQVLDLVGIDPQEIADTVDFCFDLDPVDFARDVQVSWPAAEAPRGPRTLIVVHGQNGGGYPADDDIFEQLRALRFGPRNLEAYALDYNAGFAVDPDTDSPYPMRLLGVDESGAAYVAYSDVHPVTPEDFSLRNVAAFLHDALLNVPVRGKPILEAHSMGGFPVRDLLHQRYDDLRFRGLEPAQIVTAGHPFLGQIIPSREAIAITCSNIYSYDTSGEVDVDPATNVQNCALNRWLEGWNQAASGTSDDLERPYVRFDNAYGTGDGQRPIPFAEEVSGVDVSTLTGDGTVDAQSAKGADFHGAYFVDQLAFDANVECPSCADHSGAELLGALLAADPATYTDTAVCGDLSDDGVVDGVDLLTQRQQLAGAVLLTTAQLDHCDIGSGSGCDIVDVARMGRALAEVPVPPGISQDCPAAIDLADRLSLYWPFDAMEAGPFTNNAAPSCSVRFDGRRVGNAGLVAGVVGAGAISLDGAGDGVSILEFEQQALAALEAYTRLGVSMWIRPAALPAPRAALISKAGEYEIAVRSDGVLLVTMTPSGVNPVTIDTGHVIPLSIETHVALSYDGRAGWVRVFVDGVSIHEQPFAPRLGDATPGTNALQVGRASGAADFAGVIDEVAVWDRPLGADEASRLYGSGEGLSLDPGGTGLVACTHLATPNVQFVLDETAWMNLVGGRILFDTTAANLAHSSELASAPGGNAQMGPTLTFTGAPGMCRDFQLRALQSGAHLVFQDQEWANPIPSSISIGDIDNHENDDWRFTWLGGAPMYSFGTFLIDDGSVGGESLRVYDTGGQLLGSLNTIPVSAGETQDFLGVISNLPIGSIVFDEDAGGDDIAIRHFRFGIDTNQNAVPDCNE